MSSNGVVVLPEYVGGTLLGQQIEKYYVTTLHAQGPIADVYFADDIETGERVCIKVLPAELFKSKIAYTRLQKRIELVSKRLNHPSIDVPVAHSINTHGLFLIFSKHLSGRVLGRLVQKKGPLKERTALSVLRLAAKALDYAHSQGIIHGNLKPNNLLLTPDGRLIILDWACPRTSMLFAQNRLSEGVVRDTSIDTGIAYLAPELIQETDDVYPGCDIFSLGAVLCFLLSASPPFLGDDKTVKRKIAYADAPDMIDKIPGIKVSTAKLILKMMDSDSGNRYKRVPEFLPEIEKLLS